MVNEDTITVSADSFARSVQIWNKDDDLILSDNYFDLHAEAKTVRILSGKAVGIRVRSVYDIAQQ